MWGFYGFWKIGVLASDFCGTVVFDACVLVFLGSVIDLPRHPVLGSIFSCGILKE